MENGSKPATKQDLVQLEAKLKEASRQDLAQLESKLKEASRQDLAQLESKLKEASRQDLAELEAKLKEASKKDLTEFEAKLLEAMHDMETRLLKGFFGYTETTQKRFTEFDRTNVSVHERLSTIEDRVTELERRINFPRFNP